MVFLTELIFCKFSWKGRLPLFVVLYCFFILFIVNFACYGKNGDSNELLDEKDVPLLYSEVRSIFLKLHDQQFEGYRGDKLFITDVEIINAPYAELKIVPHIEENTQRIQNTLTITTRKLQMLFETDGKYSANDLGPGKTRLVGAIAREVVANYDQLFSNDPNPAPEVKADLDAVILLRKAGYPEDAAYMATKHFEKGVLKSLMAARLTAQRIFLTLNRYLNGQSTLSSKSAIRPGIISELKKFETKITTEQSYIAPKTIDEAEIRIGKLLADNDFFNVNKTDKLRNLLKNYYSMLEKKGKQLTHQEIESFIKIQSSIITHSDFDDFTSENGKSLIPGNAAIFDNPVYKNWLKVNIDTILSEMVKGNGFKLAFLEKPRRIYKTFAESYLKYFEEEPLDLVHKATNYSKLLEVIPAGYGVRLIRDIQVNLFPVLLRGDRYAIIVKSDISENGDFLIPKISRDANKSEVNSSQNLPLGNDGIWAIQKEAAEYIWNNRAEYALLDFLSKASIDWDYIFKRVGISKKMGIEELNKSVKEFTSSGKYINFLDTISRSELEGFKPDKISKSSWANADLLPYIDGDFNPHFNDQIRDASYREHKLMHDRDFKYLTALNKMKGKIAYQYLSCHPNLYRQHFAKSLRDFLSTQEGKEAMKNAGKEYEEVVKLHNVKNKSTKTSVNFETNQFDSIIKGVLYIDNVYQNSMKALDPTNNIATIAPVNDIIAREIMNSSLDKTTKASVLESLFLPKVGFFDNYHNSFNSFSQQTIPMEASSWHFDLITKKKVLASLIRAGVIDNESQYLRYQHSVEIKVDDKSKKIKVDDEKLRKLYVDVDNLENQIMADLKNIQDSSETAEKKFEKLYAYLKATINPYELNGKKNMYSNISSIRRIKDRAVEIVEGIAVPLEKQMKLVGLISITGGTEKTDNFFKKQHDLKNRKPLSREQSDILDRLLRQGAIEDRELQVDLAQRLIKDKLRFLKNTNYTTKQVTDLVNEFDQLVPSASLKKDKVLENIGWQLDLANTPDGLKILKYLEDSKSTNWRRINSASVLWATFAADNFQYLDEAGRYDLIDYLTNPKSKIPPVAVLNAVKQAAIRQAAEVAQGFDLNIDKFSKNKLLRSMEEAITFRAVEYIKTLPRLTPIEKVPLVESILTGGERPLITEEGKDATWDIGKRFLNTEYDNVEGKLMKSFLEIIPPLSKAAHLAYLICHNGPGKSKITALFQLLGPSAIKKGQIAPYLLSIDDPQIIKDLLKLQDASDPMTLFEIRSIMEKLLSPEQLKRIKIIKILGSASLKTVLLVKIDGKEAVMALQPGNAESRIANGVDMDRKLLARMKVNGLEEIASAFDVFVEPNEKQLEEELDMRKEAAKIKKTQEVISAIAKDMGDTLNGWTIESPGLIDGFEPQKQLLVMEYAKGITMRRLLKADDILKQKELRTDGKPEQKELRTDGKPEQKVLAPASNSLKAKYKDSVKKVGQISNEIALRTLFSYGYYNPDGHPGNVLVDLKGKTISFIDPAQAESFDIKGGMFTSNEMYQISQLLRALGEGNAFLLPISI
ncbi:MAG: hypothetical protein A2381_02770 [Bdellovibrionales bacterium RIFOXYB1_FULL_37_110]|nr:MAG: hypothetical protein A2181_03150 [Bdellovibrionales bacterium RIFOXYA1_FULL_38_20]OFZ57856.1 MAG: hypothetical protein A2381_02770 [Bdellovibrionales bacterium RIFOXYB1_FULL_37_110]OFZ63582.1 MAG: hypothetical protein A2577_05070 [Bdellovibrionales bacterium RIFOXYD1_FULL_36_51]